MDVSSLPFFRSSQTVSRANDVRIPHNIACNRLSNQSTSTLRGESSTTSSVCSNIATGQLPHIGWKRSASPVDWGRPDLHPGHCHKLPAPSKLRKRGKERKRIYKMRGPDISEHISVLKRKHLALDRERAQSSLQCYDDISCDLEESSSTVQEVPSSPQLRSAIMAITASCSSSLQEHSKYEKCFNVQCSPAEDPETSAIVETKQLVTEECVSTDAVGFEFGSSDLPSTSEKYNPSPSSAEQAPSWLLPGSPRVEEFPLPVSLEADHDLSLNDTTMLKSHSFSPPCSNIVYEPLQTPPEFLQQLCPLSLSPADGCSFNPSTFSIQNYYPREE